MIYLIGGAPRAGKSTLGRQFASKLNIGWTSTDLLADLLRAADVSWVPTEWDASSQTIRQVAHHFAPLLRRYIWGLGAQTTDYLIEGVGFLPEQAVQLANEFPISSVFLGSSQMTLGKFDRYPGHSGGYATLPETLRQQMANDVPMWSKLIEQEATLHKCRYVDTASDFRTALQYAESLLLTHAAN